MTEPTVDRVRQVEEDLAFVKRAVRRRSAGILPLPAAVLWAVIILPGFAMADFALRYIWHYWLIAGPAGFVVTALLEWRTNRRVGEEDSGQGMRDMLHWMGVMVCWFIVFVGVWLRVIPGRSIGPVMLLVLGLGSYLYGLHSCWPYLIAGGAMILGSVVVMFHQQYVFTVLGVLVATALLLPAIMERVRRE